MAGTTGLEPATSAVTVLCRRKHLATANELKRHVELVFMPVCPLFLAPHSLSSDTTRDHTTRVGMAGLRHKSRHKISYPSRLSLANCPGVWRGWVARVNMPARVQKNFKNLPRRQRIPIRLFHGCACRRLLSLLCFAVGVFRFLPLVFLAALNK